MPKSDDRPWTNLTITEVPEDFDVDQVVTLYYVAFLGDAPAGEWTVTSTETEEKETPDDPSE